jgi:hypothetical protein
VPEQKSYISFCPIQSGRDAAWFWIHFKQRFPLPSNY